MRFSAYKTFAFLGLPLAILLFSKCTEGDKKRASDFSKPKLGRLEVASEIKHLSYTDLFKSALLVPLVTDKSNAFSDQSVQIVYVESEGFILVADLSHSRVLMFSVAGDFIRQIGQYGNGPGEISALSEIKVNESKRLIYMLNSLSNKILTYNFDGDLIDEIKIGLTKNIRSFSYIKGGFLLEVDPNPENREPAVIRISNSGIVEHEFTEVSSIYMTTAGVPSGSFYATGNDVRFFPAYSDKIFNYNGNGELESFIAIESENGFDLDRLEQYQFRTGVHYETLDNGLPLVLGLDRMWGIENYVETDSFIRFKYRTGGGIIGGLAQGFFDKRNQTFFKAILRNDFIEFDKDQVIYDFGSDYILKVVKADSYNLEEFLKAKQKRLSEQVGFASDEAEARFSDWNIGSNPILIIYKAHS